LIVYVLGKSLIPRIEKKIEQARAQLEQIEAGYLKDLDYGRVVFVVVRLIVSESDLNKHDDIDFFSEEAKSLSKEIYRKFKGDYGGVLVGRLLFNGHHKASEKYGSHSIGALVVGVRFFR